eukprot:3356475-Prymnesium_polylepis.1
MCIRDRNPSATMCRPQTSCRRRGGSSAACSRRRSRARARPPTRLRRPTTVAVYERKECKRDGA